MIDIATHFLFTSAGVLGILVLCAAALAALPWSLADQAATERGLAHGGDRVAAALATAWGAFRGGGAARKHRDAVTA